MATPIPSRLSFAGAIRPGATVEARWIAGHPMESGRRVDDSGRKIGRNVITQIRVTLNGRLILDAEPGTGMSSNPYLAFAVTVPLEGGTVQVDWLDDTGNRGSVQRVLLLEP